MLSTSRSQALADTLDWLEERCRSGSVYVRVGAHDGTTLEGVLHSVTRRQVQVALPGETPPVSLNTSDIAKLWIQTLAPEGAQPMRWIRWELWFDYGPS